MRNSATNDLFIIVMLCITLIICVNSCNEAADHEKEMIELEKEKLRLQIEIHKINLGK